MTALLTDEQIIVACHNHAQAATRLMGDTEERQEHLEYAERDFEEGARFARSIYEARLAEDAKREALWRKLLNHLDEQVIDKLDADGSCSLCKELRAALGLEEIK